MSTAPAEATLLRDPVERAYGGAPRRLLLLSYHFPPNTSTGAIRWQRLAELAAEHGWGLDVVTRGRPPRRGAELTVPEPLPPGVRVYGVPERSSLLQRATGWGARVLAAAELIWRADLRARPLGPEVARRALHAAAFFADEAAWARGAAALARTLVRPGLHRAVVTCGPPHMVHAAGRRLARRTGLPLVMDLRDPWSLVPALPVEIASPLWYRLAERHERRAVRQATLVVANTEPLRDAMRRAHPESGAEFVAVLNGCDPLPVASAGRSGRFLVVFSGNIYIDRDPRPFLRAAAGLIRRRGLGPDRFGIEFLGYAGEFGGVPLAALAEAEGIGAFLATHPRRPHREALAFMARASMLLSLPQDVELAIPSKLFEYMQFPSWMLVLAKRGSATERLLRHTGADVVEPDDLEGIERVLELRFDQHQRGERARPINADGRFDRRRQAERLFEALEARLAATTPHAGGR